ncbi:MAG TPA: ribose 5-phosphate isomerase A [Candidatus Saccharimonadales bacterium]|jgi:ribose 5-phosphate isomerase A
MSNSGTPKEPWPQLAVWDREITNRAEKERLAQVLAKQLKNGDTVGVGSGSTSFLVLIALADKCTREDLSFTAIPTSLEMELHCAALNIPTTSLSVARPDWSFDGADEADKADNLIKGRGGAFFREKILIRASKQVFIVIDSTKRVSQLGKKFPVPVEVYPGALRLVRDILESSANVTTVDLRQAKGKDGPVVTENGNLILDVKFSKIMPDTESYLKSIVGVIESGLFIGYKPTIISDN